MTMPKLRTLLTEGGGEAAGSLEILSVTPEKAKEFAQTQGLDIEKDFTDFDANLKHAKKLASGGKTKRKDMPVIDGRVLRQFQGRLKQGYIDIHEPFAQDTNPKNPFPQGLTGPEARTFLERGLRDGDHGDDIVPVSSKKVPVGKLKPIQKQIYYDKSASMIHNWGEKLKPWLGGQTFFLASEDNYIIDGHHRWLAAVLVDPDMPVQVLTIDLPLSKLLPMSVAFSDAVGNKRNA